MPIGPARLQLAKNSGAGAFVGEAWLAKSSVKAVQQKERKW